MPLDDFNDSACTQRRDSTSRPRLHPNATVAVVALISDVAYFWWVFAGLGAVMLVAALY